MFVEDYGDYQIEIAKQDRAAYGWAVVRPGDGWRYQHTLLYETMLDAAQAALDWIDAEMLEAEEADRVRDLIERRDQRRIQRVASRAQRRIAEAPMTQMPEDTSGTID